MEALLVSADRTPRQLQRAALVAQLALLNALLVAVRDRLHHLDQLDEIGALTLRL